jgi:hypothetical protein
MVITADQAKQISDFMYMLADIGLDNAEKELREEKSSDSSSNGFKPDSK